MPIAALIAILTIATFMLRVYLEDIFVGIIVTGLVLGATYWVHTQLQSVK